jgi:hypothetical protein
MMNKLFKDRGNFAIKSNYQKTGTTLSAFPKLLVNKQEEHAEGNPSLWIKLEKIWMLRRINSKPNHILPISQTWIN